MGETLTAAGLELVDGSISGGPPRADYRTRVYVSGPRAVQLAEAAPAWLDLRVVGDEVGLASAVKMCTASMYKGSTALLLHALATAQAHGVLPQVLDDLGDAFPRQIEHAGRQIAVSAAKAGRFVGEMHEISATQESVGLTPALFEAIADVYRAVAETPLAAQAPEDVAPAPELASVLEQLGGRRAVLSAFGRSRPVRGRRAMRARGVEPPRAEAHRDLNPARLPVPPRPLEGTA